MTIDTSKFQAMLDSVQTDYAKLHEVSALLRDIMQKPISQTPELMQAYRLIAGELAALELKTAEIKGIMNRRYEPLTTVSYKKEFDDTP